MKYKIKYLSETVADRDEIKKYLSQFGANTPKKFFDLLKHNIEVIKKYPYSCQAYDGDPDYRKMVVGDYLVFYIVNDDEKTIEIHRMFHASRDIKRQLK
jgi:addiction module RelE/StbE family toxin